MFDQRQAAPCDRSDRSDRDQYDQDSNPFFYHYL
jgi:hypothetical protein